MEKNSSLPAQIFVALFVLVSLSTITWGFKQNFFIGVTFSSIFAAACLWFFLSSKKEDDA